MSPKHQTWSDLVQLRARYQRSVHLERDAKSEHSLDGYVLTPLVRTLVRRILDGFESTSLARAWSVTGPYGTGKSAFAVFLADVLSPADVDTGVAARKLLAKTDPTLATALCGARGLFRGDDGLWPVLATGERGPIHTVLLRALHHAVEDFWSGRGAKPSIVAHVAKLARRAVAGQRIATREVVAIFEEVAQKVAKSNLPGRGLVVMLDEAGKALEYSAQHPDEDDVQLLQELAEAANRSGDAPIVFVVFLHQAFEQYAGRLSLTERGEWAKVQGRFEDLAFQETSHELLRLTGEALERRTASAKIQAEIERCVHRAASALARLTSTDVKRLEPLLAAALPLHPATAILVGPLFRSRIAQNERSLFAFLGSSEPRGFQEFLQRSSITSDDGLSLFAPDALYDYVAVSLGARLDGHMGRQWAQIETALRRLPEGATELDAKLIKAVGILGLFGEGVGLSASSELLELIYAGKAHAARAVAESLERLRRASLVVFRKFRGAFQLWEGSDIDVESLVRDALHQVDASASLVQRMTRVAPPRPIVARRHLLETGNFRYFELRYVDAAALDEGFPELDSNADGGVLLVVEGQDSARGKFLQRIKVPMTWMPVATQESKPYLVGVPRHVGRLLEVGAELAALEWVQTHTPELQDDMVARREVAKRITEAEQQLRSELTRVLNGEVDCEWFDKGKSVAIDSLRDLARTVSDMCDAAYAKAPIIQNELLNRRQLSSAAAAARRNLLEAMVTKAATERLDFEGTPPEVSMYRSFLEHHGLHRKRDGKWSFGPPIDKKHGSLRPAWDAIDKALRDADEARVSLARLFERLRQPPFGVKDGVLPVLFVAAALHWKDEIALYEDGAFVPALSGAVIERLLRQWERFEAQRLSITGPRAALHARLMQTLTGGKSTPGIVPIVRQFVRVVSDLPDFARTTKAVSPKAQAVREVLLRAKEPAPLVFRDLPVACGLPPFEASGKPTQESVDHYVEELRGAMRELQTAYPGLLDSIEESLRANFALPKNPASLRSELAARASRVIRAAVDAQLKAFLIRARDEEMPREEWLVSVGTFLAGKPPESWHDRDLDQLHVTVGLLARRFSSLESLPLPGDAAPDSQLPPMLRIAIMQPGVAEHERTVALRSEDDALVNSVCVQLRSLTQSASASLPRESILAALGMVTRDLILELSSARRAENEVSA